MHVSCYNSLVVVKNAENEPNSEAMIIVKNEISYTPKVSVIIPVYNVEKYLRECLDSVVNQTLKEIEIICIDDGSTDNSLEILKEYASKDNRFTIITQKNLHAGIARNAGLSVAKGEYVHFLDSDDWIDINTYEELYDLIKEKDVELVKFKSFSFDNQLQKIRSTGYTDIRWVNEKYFDDYLSIYNDANDIIRLPDAPWSGIYNRSFLEKEVIRFDNLVCANDVGFFYRCIINAKKVYLSSKRFVYYRENVSKSLITKRADNFDCQTALFGIVSRNAKKLPEDVQNVIHNKLIEATLNWYIKCLKYPDISLKTVEELNKCIRIFIDKISYVKLNKSSSNLKNKILGCLECFKYYFLGVPILLIEKNNTDC